MTQNQEHPPVELRKLILEDYPQYRDLEDRCYKHMDPYDKDMFESRIRHFPEGQLGIFFEDRLVGACNSLIVDIDEYSETHSWEEISDKGYIRNHDPEGDTLYGIEIFVDPEHRNMKLGRRLYNARKELCRRLNLRRILIAGRMPRYHEHAGEMSVREYIEAVQDKRIYDPVLTFQFSNNFTIKRIMKHYLKEDRDSKEYATLMEWVNLDFEPGKELNRKRVLSRPARICAIQYKMRKIAGWDEFTQQVEYFVDVASEYKSDFALFPELISTQLLSFTEEKRPGLAARELTTFTGRYEDLFREMAINYNVNIIAGSHFKMVDERVYNVSYLFRRDGSMEEQYKLHVTPNERQMWGLNEGSELNVFDTDRGRVAILICYDVEFPELARIAAEKGAEILFVPFSTDERQGFMRVRICAQARCIENQLYTAIAGTTGNIPSVENMTIQYAQSGIFTPSDYPFSRDGIAAMSDQNAEMVALADVDLEKTRKARHYGTVRPYKDRRTDLYQLHYKAGETLGRPQPEY